MRKSDGDERKLYESDLLKAFGIARMPLDRLQDEIAGHAHIKETSELMEAMFSTDVTGRMRDLLGDISVAVLGGLFIGAIKSDDIGNLIYFRLMLEKIITPLVAENESLRTMVRTLTVSKEITERQEEKE